MRNICFVLFVLYIFFSGCSTHIDDANKTDDNNEELQLVQKVGSRSTFELITWNIEWFPKSGENTINDVKTIIRNLDVDLIAVAEIASVSSFNALLDSLDGWKGALSNDSYGDGSYQKTGILYKNSFISLSNVKNIFPDDGYAFPRPPLSALVTIKDLQGVKYDFTLIVLHLKAFSGESNEVRRRSACEQLKQYIDDEIAAGADADFLVMGDWNDQLDDPAENNVFQVFLDDTAGYRFLTKSILGQSSYISNSFNSLIDHILISKDSFTEYGSGLTEVLYLDEEFLKYRSEVSDHRPVLAVFKGFSLELRPPSSNTP